MKVTVNYKFTLTSDLTTGRITEELFHSSSGYPRKSKMILGDILVKQIKNSSIIEDLLSVKFLKKLLNWGCVIVLTFGGINLLLVKKL